MSSNGCPISPADLLNIHRVLTIGQALGAGHHHPNFTGKGVETGC